ncbi:LysM peptidoglycan-binding domain-containing protein [Mycolicibacterium flavescens]|uniref:Peptigoglycan-binding protein LysM n=1 Tax=Mycolicibacterium flavescens TaxID=1776 RepID=A0A1E3RC34_MYCFV|nr:LysM peptidoglycan-binding domain-containing protein [Mycolicibacterium flavescens]MCV7278597.1 LysM peptidoglycan-binding domain-containing protein [Mycolicibacterium flavescens]ODQ87464.1 peptigoglycan-binding protein LysM [Mycolicibacterium flavescens]
MTILETREIQAVPAARPRRRVEPSRRGAPGRRPRSQRPGGAPLRYRGPGVVMSRASHRRRPITPGTTVLLALVAAGITVWLGLVAQFGGVVGATPAAVPDRLAVVQVQMGESLHQVAQRVAPEAPVSQVVERIRELNQLDTAALDAGQTLIAPVG